MRRELIGRIRGLDHHDVQTRRIARKLDGYKVERSCHFNDNLLKALLGRLLMDHQKHKKEKTGLELLTTIHTYIV